MFEPRKTPDVVITPCSMIPKRPLISLFLAACILVPQSRAAVEGNAKGVFNEFIATVAPVEKAYRTDIKLGADPDRVAPGRMVGKSALVGYFTYRPKLYDELSTDQRVNLRRDNRFRAFVIAVRATMDGIVAGDSDGPRVDQGDTPRTVQVGNIMNDFRPSRERRRLEYFTLTAEEMLKDRPIYVVLP